MQQNLHATQISSLARQNRYPINTSSKNGQVLFLPLALYTQEARSLRRTPRSLFWTSVRRVDLQKKPMYGTIPCCLVQGITRHTCPSPHLGSWNYLPHPAHIAPSEPMSSIDQQGSSLGSFPTSPSPLSAFWPCVKPCLVGDIGKYWYFTRKTPRTEVSHFCLYHRSTCQTKSCSLSAKNTVDLHFRGLIPIHCLTYSFQPKRKLSICPLFFI